MTPEVNSRGLERHESAGVCAAARLVCVCVCVDIWRLQLCVCARRFERVTLSLLGFETCESENAALWFMSLFLVCWVVTHTWTKSMFSDKLLCVLVTLCLCTVKRVPGVAHFALCCSVHAGVCFSDSHAPAFGQSSKAGHLRVVVHSGNNSRETKWPQQRCLFIALALHIPALLSHADFSPRACSHIFTIFHLSSTLFSRSVIYSVPTTTWKKHLPCCNILTCSLSFTH